ncbi:MAG: GAF domain-containing protein [Euryarchaeota archaeon]|nr:GAF domain-containing protein [Euryarchaeota archaeon]MBU4547383.1 GAF domain-containing protein [Euryarchaeota archaeon]MBV1755674.1 GAF domain-containing protein [Methanobacterium sp.]MBV1767843.1 GAF domain-containing protein [Methanobacterium sp.]
MDLLEFQKGGVYLIEDDDLKLKIHKNFDRDMLKANANFKVDNKPFTSLLTEGSCFISNCYPEINPEKARRWKVNSIAAVPLKFKEEILGMLVVFGEYKHPFL